MCKETFLRLPEEKRNRFLDAAWEEFTRVKFADVSINQIVRRAGIPRGSFYQSFEGKEDLFRYLLNTAMKQFAASYRKMMQQAEGDLFRTQLMCYDCFVERTSAEGPTFDRCIQLMRINPGMDIQKMMPERPAAELMEQTAAKMDLSRFRRTDTEFVWQVFVLALLALGSAIMDSLTHPEDAAEHRRRLSAQMEIIQWGSMRAESLLAPEEEEG